MKKIKIGKSIKDVIDEEEYMRRLDLNKDLVDSMSIDTAVEKDGMVFPVNKQYSDSVPNVYNAGPVLVYTMPQEYKNNQDYYSSNIIDFTNTQGLSDSINKQAKLMEAERSILVSPDNIFTPVIKESDSPEMKLFKQAVARKRIDLDAYKPRFGSDFNNDKRSFDLSTITFFKLKRLCNIFDIKGSITFEDIKGAPNPIGEKLSITFTNGDDEIGEDENV